MKDSVLEILTVGHSTQTYEQFLRLLRESGVTALADVRSSPFSRRYPQFNGEHLRNELRLDGISYAFLGQELGGRPTDPTLFRDGVADYERMATTKEFESGLERVIDGARRHRIALMCSEANPLECHRCLLIGRALAEHGVQVSHLLPDGRIASQSQIEQRLLDDSGRDSDDFFASREERLANAYREQAQRVAFALTGLGTNRSVATG